MWCDRVVLIRMNLNHLSTETRIYSPKTDRNQRGIMLEWERKKRGNRTAPHSTAHKTNHLLNALRNMIWNQRIAFSKLIGEDYSILTIDIFAKPAVWQKLRLQQRLLIGERFHSTWNRWRIKVQRQMNWWR